MADHKDGFQSIIDAARKAVQPQPMAGEVWVIPHGPEGEALLVDMERVLDRPNRLRGTTIVYGAAAFNQLVRDACTDEAASPYVYIDRDPDKPQIVAVLNGNSGRLPGWGDWRVEIALRPTAPWKKWTAMDGKLHSQSVFADFIEENRDDVVEPSGAAMLEIATYLEATKKTQFKSGVRLGNGDIELMNIENTEARVGAGKIAVPETFRLGITPFVGGARYEVPARFRYRVEDGTLKLGFALQRREDLVNAVINDLVEAIEKGTDNAWAIEGMPPPATKPAPFDPAA